MSQAIQNLVEKYDAAAWGYAQDVVEGKIPACEYVKKQCENALDRLTQFKAGDCPYTYDSARGTRPAIFAKLSCRHLKGPLAGAAIEFKPWQLFLVTQVYGWVDEVGNRIVRTVYFEVPRKNGKSTIMSVLGIYHLGFDGEIGAEVYSAAKTRDQARIVFDDAQNMVKASPALGTTLKRQRDSLTRTDMNAKFVPLASDAGSLEGKNPSFAIVDEVHTHRNSEIWDVLAIASGARAQPLQFGITTAGTDRAGVAYRLRDYTIKTIQGQVEDDSFWGMVYTLDEGDEWNSLASFAKANPNYDVSVRPDDMVRLAKQSEESPSAKVNFMTKRLNVWSNAAVAWLSMSQWDACGELERPPISHWRGKPAYIGLDLASVSDVTCVAICFAEDGIVYPYVTSFLPEDTVFAKGGHYGRIYQGWLDDGLLQITPGNVTDLRYIKEYVLTLCGEYNVKEIAFDPWGASELSADLLDQGLPMVKMGQGISAMSGPSKALESLVRSKKLAHGNDDVLSWMASNCEAFTDVNENVKIRKGAPENKIDGIVATIMALGRLDINGGIRDSVYEQRGIRYL